MEYDIEIIMYWQVEQSLVDHSCEGWHMVGPAQVKDSDYLHKQ